MKIDPREPQVKGIMSNLILILIKAKWDPESLYQWRDPRGTRWTMAGVSTSPDVVANIINRDFLNIELHRADGHYNGSGLKNGLHINATLKILRKLKIPILIQNVF